MGYKWQNIIGDTFMRHPVQWGACLLRSLRLSVCLSVIFSLQCCS